MAQGIECRIAISPYAIVDTPHGYIRTVPTRLIQGKEGLSLIVHLKRKHLQRISLVAFEAYSLPIHLHMASRQDGTGKEADRGPFELDDAVVESNDIPHLWTMRTPLTINVCAGLPIPGTKVLSCHAYGMWVWARQARLVCQLPTGEQVNYFLKVTEDPLRGPRSAADLNRLPLAKATG
jgi:hypothetical protein